MTLKNLKILVPTDFSDRSFKALRPAEYLAQLFDGTVNIMTRYESKDLPSFPSPPPPQKNEEEIEEELLEVAKKYIDEKYIGKAIVRMGSTPSRAIIDESKNHDLVSITTHGRGGFSRLLLGSVTEKVLRFSYTPVLAVEEEGIRPLKNILVTTDFSKNSIEAFPYAKEIAKASGAKVDLLNIAIKNQYIKEKDMENHRKMRQDMLKELIDEHFGDIKDQIRAEMIAAETSIHEAITRRVNEKDYHMVIMSTLGRSKLEYLRLGSTTSYVAKHVKTAVLSINPKRQVEPAPEEL